MKITFIRPHMTSRRAADAVEPLVFGILARLTPPDVELVLYDDRIEPIPYDEPTDLVAMTVETFTAKRAYQISAQYKQRGVPVVMGGYHPTLLPEEASQHADSIFINDAEKLWHQVIDDARQGRLKPVYRGEPCIPQPDTLTRRDLYKGKKYLPISLLQFGRGCRFVCTFCAVTSYFNHGDYYRDPRQVVREIESQDRNTFFFVDDNLISNIEAAKSLFRELIPLKIHWVSQASINMTRDRELMSLMAKSGCVGNVIGFESLDRDNLIGMKKGQNLATGYESYQPQLEILRDYGLQTWAAFTLGHDYDTPDSIERTLEFAMKNKFTFVAFNTLLPYPETPLYKKLQAEDRLLFDGKWWLHPDYRYNHAAFRPARMSADQLTEWSHYARRSFNSIESIVRRVTDLKTNMRNPYRLGVYLSYNPLFRKETLKKQGIRL